jgi:hypothetical protein
MRKLTIVIQHQMSNETINRLHKGERLTLVNFRERSNAITQAGKTFATSLSTSAAMPAPQPFSQI